MSVVEIRDHALWLKHIHGNEALKEKLLDIEAGDIFELVVDGSKGHWKKMDDGADGRPTPGIKPIGPAKDHWHALQKRRGDLVPIKEGRK